MGERRRSAAEAPLVLDEIQSLVLSGHGDLPASQALWLAVDGAVGAAREGLRRLTEEHVWFGRRERTEAPRVHVALSAAGLRALDAPRDQLERLERTFAQGIVTPRRSRALGDRGPSAPERWAWRDGDAHALVLVYARTPDEARARARRIADDLAPAWRPVHALAVFLPPSGREPFGFRDGIARTRIAWDGETRDRPGLETLPAGEVLLGRRTAVETVLDVPPLGRGGSYLVARQLAQDVAAFWRFWRDAAADDDTAAVWLASKATGRWPNGMPISGSAPHPEPAADEPTILAGPRFEADPHGEDCPLGSHVRRANPRGALTDDPAQSRAIVALHRLLRRGRGYGPAAPPEWYPAPLRAALAGQGAPDADAERGLLFVALCGDIARQFEFVQQMWLAHPKFADLYDEIDPIGGGEGVGAPDAPRPGHFTVPRPPERGPRRRLSAVRGWVTVRGGGYFLLPGRSAILDVLAP